MTDTSSGYEENASRFLTSRHPSIGVDVVRDWAQQLAPGAAVLELGCGFGEPVSRTLLEAGVELCAVDASSTLLATFQKRFASVETECASAQQAAMLDRTYDGVIAVGLLFLLTDDDQRYVIRRVADSLRPGGRFLFSAPRERGKWNDLLTGRESQSLGVDAYEALLHEYALAVTTGIFDEGNNHYYSARRA